GFAAIDPKIFGDPDEIRKHFSRFLKELREAPKADGQTRIYTHGEKEVEAYRDRMENGWDVNINTVVEMKKLCDYLGMDYKEYLGDVDFSDASKNMYEQTLGGK
ncbi:MAG: Ldh family oxidoreductase, partial [Lachnospiraceae bacterium]|nr:Ldh family oxidoreductase [Lachnospiraceae bacterium]